MNDCFITPHGADPLPMLLNDSTVAVALAVMVALEWPNSRAK